MVKLLMDNNQSYMCESIIKTQYLSNLLSKKADYNDLLSGKFHHLNFKITDKDLKIIVIQIDAYYNLITHLETYELEHIKYNIMNITEEKISTCYNCEVLEYNEDIVVILNINDDNQKLTNILEDLKTDIKTYLGESISIGIGKLCSSISEIYTSYDEALNSLELKFFLGENLTIFFDDIKHSYKNDNIYPLALESDIINCIKNENKEDLEIKCNSFSVFLTENRLNKKCILRAYTTLLFSVYHLMIEDNITGNELIESIDKLNRYSKFLTLNKLKEEVLTLLLLSSEKINSNRVDNKLIQMAVKYIDENYDKDIDLQIVAKNIYITPCYVSMLFKRVLDINFVDYLHKIRIDKACELLKDNKLKSYEIAYMVGFSDDKYFSRIFKKYKGLTPCQYRNKAI